MGDCVHCGKPAGFFKSSHRECQVAHDAELSRKVELAARRRADADRLVQGLNAAMADLSVPLVDVESLIARGLEDELFSLQDRQRLVVEAWEFAVDRFLQDDLLTDEEEARLTLAAERFALPTTQKGAAGGLTRFAKASILKGVMRGDDLPCIDTPPDFPFNLQKTERVVWIDHGVRYLEDKVRRETVGGSRGVSVRVVSGVYVRLGAFKAKPVFSTERVEIATGSLCVTDRSLYFRSPAHSMRIPFGKIVSFEQFSDGLGVMRDAASAKPQFFINGDGWFLYNLVTNLAYRE